MWLAFVIRHASPWRRKMSATSSVGRVTCGPPGSWSRAGRRAGDRAAGDRAAGDRAGRRAGARGHFRDAELRGRPPSQGPSKNDIIPRAPARAPAAGPGIEPPVTGPPLTAPAAGPGPADTSGAPSYGAVRQAKGLLKMTLSPWVNHFRQASARARHRNTKSESS